MGENLFNKVWAKHKVERLPSGQDQLFIGTHLIHEVTSPQAFAMLEERKLKVKYPERTFATVDHIVPTLDQQRPFQDELAEKMMVAIEDNTKNNNIEFFGLDTPYQGVVHIVGPELGLTRPGMTIACGDSHTATHGAFGAIAFGIGTSQIRDILATQTMAMNKPKVKQIFITGKRQKGVYAKDIILKIIQELGVNGGLGFAYEFAGPAIEELSMEERMTICNMAIEGGARVGYINPDQTTFDYLKGKKYSPEGADWDKSVEYWKSMASDSDAQYDDRWELDITNLAPMVTWGVTPAQGISVEEKIPALSTYTEDGQEIAKKGLDFMEFNENDSMIGKKIDVVFIGSCTNGRISDLRVAAEIVKGKKVDPNIRTLVVPGSKLVQKQAEEEGLAKIFTDAGMTWHNAGCSMCLAMNPDQLKGRELSASTSNRNFIGRQGCPTGRTLLVSPAMAAAAALNGKIVDVRELV